MSTEPDYSVLVSRRRSDYSLVTVLGLVGCLGVFWALGGVVGLVAGFGLGLAAIVAHEVILVALGHLVVAVLLPDSPPVTTVLLAVSPLLVVLAAPVVATRQPVGTTGRMLILGGIVYGGSVLAITTQQQYWAAALIVGSISGLGIYGLHRYSVVRFEEDADERTRLDEETDE